MKLAAVILAVASLGLTPPVPKISTPLLSPKDASSQSGSPMVKSSLVSPQLLTAVFNPNAATITLAYTLQPISGPMLPYYTTGISSSIDFTNWTVVWTNAYPYGNMNVQVTLSNQPTAGCFYKAFWSTTLF